MLTRLLTSCGLAAIVLILSPAAGLLWAMDAGDLLFYHSFDQGAAADFARGSPSPVNNPQPLFVDGVIGRGLSVGLKPEHTLTFPCAGNLDAREGTLAFWVLPVGWNPNGIMANSPTYMNFGGKGASVLVYTWGVDNDTKFLMQYEGGAHVASLIYSGGWKPGWNHVACTWRRGEMVTYHNGQKVASKSPGAFLLPEEFLGNFNVGGYLGGKPEGMSTVLDDLYVFRRALAADEIRLLWSKGAAQQGPVTFQAGRVTPSVDGAVTDAEWAGAGMVTGLVDRFTGLVDDDPAVVFLGHDAERLLLAARWPVPERVRQNPVFYPTGPLKADARARDGHVRDDDCYLFSIRGGDGAVYQFQVNSAGALADLRNGDPAWNAEVQSAVRADSNAWTLELAIPWAALGFTAKPGQIAFNARRIWKTMRPGLGELAPGAEDRAFAEVALVDGPAATVALSPGLAAGDVSVIGTAPSGVLEVQAGELSLRKDFQGKVEVEHRFDRPIQASASLRLTDAAGHVLFQRAVPFAKLAPSRSRLIDYPGAGVLLVEMDTLGSPQPDWTARVVLVDGSGREVLSAQAPPFDGTHTTCRLDVASLPAGLYTARVLILAGNREIQRDEMPYQRHSRPEWLGSQAGITPTVPPPWTPMTVRRQAGQVTIGCWGREYVFSGGILPAQIVSRGQGLLAEPIRIRATIAGEEQLVTAGDLQVTEETARRCAFRGSARLPKDYPVAVSGWIEYDGLMWLEMTLGPGPADLTLESLFLEVPLATAHAGLIYSGSYTGQGTGLVGSQPREVGSGCWVGDADRGLQWVLPSFRGWAHRGPRGTIELVPGPEQTLLRFRLIDKPVAAAPARSIALGLHATPVKPFPHDYPLWRFAREPDQPNPAPYRFFDLGAWGWCYPNYPIPKEVVQGKADTPEKRRELAQGSAAWQQRVNGTTCYYMFGPWAWVGSPEYAQWHYEWAHDGAGTDPDPRSDAWGPACHNSSFNDLVAHLLQKTVGWFPVRGLYFDCTGAPECSNAYHGCGWVDESGTRRPEQPILATRRYYERIYTIMKQADANAHVAVHMSGQPIMAFYAFADSLVEGEQFATGLRGRKGTKPEAVDYFDYLTLPFFRAEFCGRNFGVPVAFLPEFAPASGDSPESRRWWYATGRPVVYVGTAPEGHEAELYTANRAVEHLVGMALVHDSRLWATYAVMASQYAVWRAEQEFGWDASVEFLPYWRRDQYLAMEGGVPEKVVVSAYRKPGRVLLVPLNDTDQPVTLRMRPNLKALGLVSPGAEVKDLYRWQAFEGPTEGGRFIFRGNRDVFPLRDGTVACEVPPRSFRMLLLADEPPPAVPTSP